MHALYQGGGNGDREAMRCHRYVQLVWGVPDVDSLSEVLPSPWQIVNDPATGRPRVCKDANGRGVVKCAVPTDAKGACEDYNRKLDKVLAWADEPDGEDS